MKTKKILSILILIIILLLAFAIFKKFYNPIDESNKKTDQLSEKQVASIVKKISKLIVVPSDEKPMIVPILNADELIAEQRFYIGSEDGDYVIVYPNAKKAIIYRESENKLINVGPVIVDQPATTTTQQSTTTQTESATTSAKKTQ